MFSARLLLRFLETTALCGAVASKHSAAVVGLVAKFVACWW